MNNNTNPTAALQPLQDFIDDAYHGDYAGIARKMSDIIYLLHYVPSGSFTDETIQNSVFVLERLRESFAKAQRRPQKE